MNKKSGMTYETSIWKSQGDFLMVELMERRLEGWMARENHNTPLGQVLPYPFAAHCSGNAKDGNEIVILSRKPLEPEKVAVLTTLMKTYAEILLPFFPEVEALIKKEEKPKMAKSKLSVTEAEALHIIKNIDLRPFEEMDYRNFEGMEKQYHPKIGAWEQYDLPITVIENDLEVYTFFFGEDGTDNCQVFQRLKDMLVEIK